MLTHERGLRCSRLHARLIHELGEYIGYSPLSLLERLIKDAWKIYKQRLILQETLATATQPRFEVQLETNVSLISCTTRGVVAGRQKAGIEISPQSLMIWEVICDDRPFNRTSFTGLRHVERRPTHLFNLCQLSRPRSCLYSLVRLCITIRVRRNQVSPNEALIHQIRDR